MVRAVSVSICCAICCAPGLTGTAAAQGYPTRPIQFVVPYPPGGGNDIFARVLAGPLQESLGQSVVVDNRAGAGGTIGTASVARATPDGHTLLLGSSGALAIAPILMPKVPYNAAKD